MHNRIRVSGMAISAALLLAMSVPMLRAGTTDKRTTVTFGEAVEVPGMVLLPGTYVFELANGQDRNIVQVFDQDQTHLLTTFLAIHDYRLEPVNKTVIQLQERDAKAPQVVLSWFYPGDSNGLEFIYPKSNPSSAVARPAVH